MNKELKEIVEKEVSEFDLVKTYLAFYYNRYRYFTINWRLGVDTQSKLQELGLYVEIVSDWSHGDYTIIKYPR